MGRRTVNVQSTLSISVILLGAVIILLALGGCASTPPGPGPGSPDEIQMQHYEMLKSAIVAKDRTNALAALALFQGDMLRWHTNILTEAAALTELLALTDAVDKGEWASANKKLMELKSKYRPE